MLDEKTQMMLEAASALTAEDIEFLKSGMKPASKQNEAVQNPQSTADVEIETENVSAAQVHTLDEEDSLPNSTPATGKQKASGRGRKGKTKSAGNASPSIQIVTGSRSRGEYERNRTRESKVSTACLGAAREKHEWWPLGTELIARLGHERFEATVVSNPSVKSGRSLVITSGAALGKVCITPTRAAIEATEAFRAANHIGRGGGVTNGWTFWELKK